MEHVYNGSRSAKEIGQAEVYLFESYAASYSSQVCRNMKMMAVHLI